MPYILENLATSSPSSPNISWVGNDTYSYSLSPPDQTAKALRIVRLLKDRLGVTEADDLLKLVDEISGLL